MVFTCFSAKLGRHFSKSNDVGRHFCPDFQGFCLEYLGISFGFSGILPKFSEILPGFSTNENFWGCACVGFPVGLEPPNSQRGPCASDTQLDLLKAWCPRRWTKPNAMRIEVMRGHTKSLDANAKLIQTRSHERDTIASRKRQVVMRKVKSTILALPPPTPLIVFVG